MQHRVPGGTAQGRWIHTQALLQQSHENGRLRAYQKMQEAQLAQVQVQGGSKTGTKEHSIGMVVPWMVVPRGDLGNDTGLDDREGCKRPARILDTPR
eukprot:6774067-Heterocapsa_arctica.AAC.1